MGDTRFIVGYLRGGEYPRQFHRAVITSLVCSRGYKTMPDTTQDQSRQIR